jgi:hypothetical protein
MSLMVLHFSFLLFLVHSKAKVQTVWALIDSLFVSGFFTIDLHALRFAPTHYALRHYASKASHALRHWTLSASTDSKQWVVLSEHCDDRALNEPGAWALWELERARTVAGAGGGAQLLQVLNEFGSRQSAASAASAKAGKEQEKSNAAGSGSSVRALAPAAGSAASAASSSSSSSAAASAPFGYRYFRIQMTGKNSSQHFWNLCCSGFELCMISTLACAIALRLTHFACVGGTDGVLNPRLRTAADPPPDGSTSHHFRSAALCLSLTLCGGI